MDDPKINEQPKFDESANGWWWLFNNDKWIAVRVEYTPPFADFNGALSAYFGFDAWLIRENEKEQWGGRIAEPPLPEMK